MGCNCMQFSKERQTYENTKRLAKAWAKSQGVTVVIYRIEMGRYAFSEVSAINIQKVDAVEFISGL